MRKNKYLYLLLLASIICLLFVYSDTRDKTFSIDIKGNNIYSLNDPYLVYDTTQHLNIEVIGEGYDVYNNNGYYGYRYGPSILYNYDGSLDCYYSSPGSGNQWDYIRYSHFADNNWSTEKIVLSPTRYSLDMYSTCDPGIVFFDGYYYLGYTSTNNSNYGGVNNNVFVARSTNPSGPFEKWNGNGWGGDPKPIISFEGGEKDWGAGEISFVIYDDKLYCYYSWIGSGNNVTKLSIAQLCQDWPNTLEYVSDAIGKTNGQDSFDVAYVDEYESFIAIAVEERLTENSSIAIYESEDGIYFEKSCNLKDGILPYAHNAGISKDCCGHIDINKDLIIGYAYGPNWGRWSTRFQPIQIKTYLKNR